jgi:uncharacterized protein YfaS (alpha-2-macroglobulin family)
VIDTYDKGDRPIIFADFKKASGEASNATVTLKLINPDGTQSTRTAVQVGAVGHYEYELALTGADAISGVWEYRFQATGALEAAEEGKFSVRKSKFT